MSEPAGPEPWSPGPERPSRSSRRTRRVLIGLGALAALGTWMALSALQIARTYRALDAGRDAVEQARTRLIDGPRGFGSEEQLPIEELGRARASFEEGHDRSDHPVLLPLRFLPVVGRQIRAVSAMSRAGAAVARAGVDALEDVDLLLEQEHGPGPQRVETLRRFAEIAERTEARLARIDLGPSEALVSPLSDARQTLDARVAELRSGLTDGAGGARGAADLFAGPRRYLLVAANNAEMRAGSGMWLSIGILASSEGSIELETMRSVTDVAVPAGVSLAGDLADRWGWLKPNLEWRNLMASPRFEASAELAGRMWEAAAGEPVDGVIVVDPIALQEILRALGPVRAFGREVNAGNVTKELLLRQYLRHPDGREIDERREEVGGIVSATMDALDEREWSVTRLARGLATAARGRHLLVWSPHETEMVAWRVAGVDGALPDDTLMLSVLNRGGNKLDQFLDVAADLTTRPTAAGTEVTVRVTLNNTTPTGLPRYVAGPHALTSVGEGTYLGILTLHAPGSATFGPLRGGEELPTGGTDGETRMTGTIVRVPRDERRVVTFRFTLPRDARSLEIQPSARVPGIRWKARNGVLEDGEAHRVAW